MFKTLVLQEQFEILENVISRWESDEEIDTTLFRICLLPATDWPKSGCMRKTVELALFKGIKTNKQL